MGNIRKVLASKILEPRSITPSNVWVDLCENLHIHYRNYRLEFSKKEFAEFMAAMHNLYKAAEFSMNKFEYEEGDPNILKQLMYKHALCHNSDYFTNRLAIERERDDTYHVHYRDLRLHLTQDEFEDIADSFIKAKELNDNLKEFPFKDVKEPTEVECDIEDVQPYDAGHRVLAIDYVHRDGIEHVKKLIEDGVKIRPILVAINGQRLDGFKRYMAFKELGYKKIKCIVDPNGIMGGQHGQSFEDTRECVSAV